MTSEAVKLARITEAAALRKDIIALLNNPAFSILAVFILVELLQTARVNGQPIMGSVAGTALETALITKEALAALGKTGILDALLPQAAKLLVAGSK